MAITAAAYQALLDTAIAAVLVADWATAEDNLVAAQLTLDGIPDTSMGSEEVRWRSADIHKRLEYVRRKQIASVGIQTTLMNKVNPTT